MVQTPQNGSDPSEWFRPLRMVQTPQNGSDPSEWLRPSSVYSETPS